MENTVSTEPSALEFSNDTLHIKALLKPLCQVELDIDAAPSLVAQARQSAVKRVGKEVVIPGFRKGKAPTHMVEQRYAEAIESELHRTLSELCFTQALLLTKLPLLNNELKMRYSVTQASLDKGGKLSLYFEVEPTLPQIDPSSIRLKAVKRPATDDQKVNQTVRQALLFFAEWTAVTDRPVQEEDFVLLDVDVVEEDGSLSPLFSRVRFEVTDESMAQWMKTLILGHNVGEVLDGVSIPDAEGDEQDLTPKNVKVTLHTIETAKLPELDDAWAEKLGCPSVEELRQNVAKMLNLKADAHVKEELRKQVAELLLKDYPFEVPESITEREVKFRMNNIMEDPDHLAYWNAAQLDEKKRILLTVSEQSAKSVRMFYLCRKIAHDANIKISTEKHPAQLPTNFLDLLLGNFTQPEKETNHKTQEAELFSERLFEAAEDHLIAHATIE
ncbi:MAG: trigger factor [Candidatus Rhabdochlamydia sp.]